MQLKSGSAWSKASCTIFFPLPEPHNSGEKKEEEKRKPDFVKDCPLRGLMFRLRIKDTLKLKAIFPCSFPHPQRYPGNYQKCEKFMLIKEHSWQLLKNGFFQKLKQNGFSSIFPQLTIMCDNYPCQKIFSHQKENWWRGSVSFPSFSIYSYERKMIYDYYNYISP